MTDREIFGPEDDTVPIILKLGDHGPAVKRLQEIGDIVAGRDFGPNDGIFGQATRNMVLHIQDTLGLAVDGICGPKTWSAITKWSVNGYRSNDEYIVDIRKTHKKPKLYGWKRLWGDINGITLHQTGCRMPSNAHGWHRLNAHIGIMRSGTIVLVNDPTDMIWHAQHLSRSTIGIEFEGNFCGVEGDLSTWWRPGGGPDQLTSGQKAAIPHLVDWLLDEFDTYHPDGPDGWAGTFAHRQSSRTRRADPGGEIWREWARSARETHIPDGSGTASWHTKRGRPIPREWMQQSSYPY